ncbi:rod shape-determining protein MreC [Methylomarinovum tepidoasis]|uniref:Cell shape-determining protein MreC n=1 Tax=Methylomarinovum tepidoasis TaxID=2840183 RepID=A0AAU9C8D1_9GAMM|nr:rod shape-determining protein MreC [Methylomarinovum sp. IN45]BCX88067.1 rod shape-determining protein MreC [Methylomarinovum sp. IN45]
MTAKPIFTRGPSLPARLALCVIASLTLMAADHHHRLDWARQALAFCVYPVQWLASAPVRGAEALSERLAAHQALVAENQALKRQVAELKRRTLKYEALKKENDRLRAFLDNSFKLGEQMLVAELLAVNLAPYEHRVLVNKGNQFGVHVGQPVVSVDGVVGQVVRVTPLTAEVLLITDPNHAIPVQVNRNGLRAIAVGSGEYDHLELPNLPNNVDIRPGDLLVSSGLGGVFPQGYPVARITTVEPQPGKHFARIQAKPTAALDRIREVLITWSQNTPSPFLPASPADAARP